MTQQSEELIRRAYVNLRALKENLHTGYVTDNSYYETFTRALDQLEKAGADVAEWRIYKGDYGKLEGGEILMRIDAILMYFTIQQEKTRVGFQK